MRHALTCLLAAVVPAQTFVVDAANGAGAHFTSMAVAVAAVPDGATLLVRAGTYGPFSITGKGLTVIGGPGVFSYEPATFWPPPQISVQNTSAGQSVVVRGFTFSNFAASVQVGSCAGPVLLEDLVLGNTSCACTQSPPTTFTILGSQQVMLRHCTSWALVSSNSNLVVEGCTFDGYGAICALGTCSFAFPALSLSGGTTQIVGCTIRGGIGGGGGFYPVVPSQPAIRCSGGSLRILAPSTLTGGSGVGWGSPTHAAAIDGTGSLRLDPAVAINANVAPAIAATMTTQVLAMPSLLAVSAAPGAALTASATSPIGNVVVVVVSWPGPPLQVPGIGDAFWLDASAHLFAAIGVPQAGVPVTASVAVPNVAAYTGLRLGWQSVTPAASGLLASNPTQSLVR